MAVAERVDPRTLRSRERVLDAALDLLREHGAAGCTVEAVAARSGVAKTTIYRQFRGREDLVVAALEAMKVAPTVVSSDSLVDDLEATVQELAAGLATGEFAVLLGSLIELAERSERAAALATEFGRRRRRHLVERLQRAVDDGDLDPDVDLDLVVSQLVGPLFYRRFVSRQPIPPELVTRLVRGCAAPLLAGRRESGSGSAGGGSARSAR